MFAVIKTGGKNYKVAPGETLKIEKIDTEAGKNIELTEVSMIGEGESVRVGAPFMDKSLVKATVVKHFRDDKVLVYKKKRRQGYDRLKGHRQHQTLIHIDEIVEAGKSVAKAEKKVAPEKKEAPVKKEAEAKASAAPKKAAVKATAEKKEVSKKPAAKKTADSKADKKS